MQDLETYILYFPKTKTSLAKINYLCFLIENHLYEIYILKERLVKYFKKIENFYKGDCRYTSVKNKCQQLINTVEYSVKNIKSLRHRHTHEFRYSDKDIKRLGTLSLHEEYLNGLKKTLPTHTIPFIPNFKTEYRKVRSKWKKKFNKNDKDIKIVLNECFKEINAIIFPRDGEISYPKKHISIKE